MGDDRDRNDQGRYADRIDPDTVLDVFEAREDHCRPLTASDVVDELGMARRTAHNKLNALVERGVLDTRKVGARGRVWWVPEAEADSANERAETSVEGTGGPGTAPSPDGRARDDVGDERAAVDTPPAGDGDRADRDDGEGLEADVRAWVADEWDAKSRVKDLLVDAWRTLREDGTVETAEFRERLYPPVSEHYDSPESMWQSVQRYLKNLPGVEKPGYGEWGYAGDDATRQALEAADLEASAE